MDEVKAEAITLLEQIKYLVEQQEYSCLEPGFVQHLLTFLGLSDMERGFMTAVAEKSALGQFAERNDLLGVFADWLEEQGHPQAGRFRKMTLQDGDVFVFYPTNPSRGTWCKLLMEEIGIRADELGLKMSPVELMSLQVSASAEKVFCAQHVPAEALYKAGWVPAEGSTNRAPGVLASVLQQLRALETSTYETDRIIEQIEEELAVYDRDLLIPEAVDIAEAPGAISESG